MPREPLPNAQLPREFARLLQSRYPDCGVIDCTFHFGDDDADPLTYERIEFSCSPADFAHELETRVPEGQIEAEFYGANIVVHGPLVVVLRQDAHGAAVETISAAAVQFFRGPGADGCFMFDYACELQALQYGEVLPGDCGV